MLVAPPGTVFYVAEGTYYPDDGVSNNTPVAAFTLKAGDTLIGGFPAGGSTILARRPDRNRTILSGDLNQDDTPGQMVGNNATAVVRNAANAGNITVNGVSIQKGRIGVVMTGNAIVFRNCVLAGNGHQGDDLAAIAVTEASYGGFDIVGSNGRFINCLISGNVGSKGAAGRLQGAGGSFLNCVLHGNRGGPLSVITGRSSYTLKNCIYWERQPGIPAGTSTAANLVLGQTNGSGVALDPRFWQEVDWERAPTTAGNLRLGSLSDAVNQGVNDPLHDGWDAANLPRTSNAVIDYGAFESRSPRFVDASATGGNNGVTWAGAFTSLQQAVSTLDDGTPILVAEGTYYPAVGSGSLAANRQETFEINNFQILGNFPSGGGLLADRDPKFHPTILSGDFLNNDGPSGQPSSDNSHNVVTLTAGSSAVLDGLFVEKGNTDLSPAKGNGGGILSQEKGDLTLRGVTIRNNLASSSSGEGGGIYLEDGFLTAEDCSFIENVAQDNGGGLRLVNSIFELRDCVFDECEASDDVGGARLSGCAGSMDSVVWIQNVAGNLGGAVSATTSLVNFVGCNFRLNQASINGGAGAFATADPTFLRCFFRGNQAGDDGGAVYFVGGSATLDTCLLSGNLAGDDGGAVYDSAASAGYVHCTLSGNRAVGEGGAVYNTAGTFPNFQNSVVWNNSSQGQVGNALSSLRNGSPTATTYQDSIVQHIVGGGTTATLNFASLPNPASAPSVGGDLSPRYPSLLMKLVGAGGGDSQDVLGRPLSDNSPLAGTGGQRDIGAYEAVAYYVPGAALDPALLAAKASDIVFLAANNRIVTTTGNSSVVKSGVVVTVEGHDPFTRNDRDSDKGRIRTSGSEPALVLQGSAYLGGLVVGGLSSQGTSGQVLLNNCVLEGDATFAGGNVNMDFCTALPRLVNGGVVSFGAVTIQNSNVVIRRTFLRTLDLTTCTARVSDCLFSGGRLINRGSTSTIVNCSFQTRGLNVTVPATNSNIRNEQSGQLTFLNTLLWNLRQSGLTAQGRNYNSALSSDSSSSESYSHTCILGRNLVGQGVGNFNGTDPNFDPRLLIDKIERVALPTIAGSRPIAAISVLDGTSPLIGAGSLTGVDSTMDLLGNPRVQDGGIEVGALENRFFYIDASAKGNGSGSSWANAFPSIGDLLAADSDPDYATYLMAQGTYRTALAVDIFCGSRYGGFPAGGGTFAQRDPAAYKTVITGELTPADDVAPTFSNNGETLVKLFPTSSVSPSLGGSNLDGVVLIAAKNAAVRATGVASVNNCQFEKNRFSTLPAAPLLGPAQRSGGAAISYITSNFSISDNALFVRNSSFVGNKNVTPNQVGRSNEGGAICVAPNVLGDQELGSSMSFEVSAC